MPRAGRLLALMLAAGAAHAQVQTSVGVPAQGHGSVTLSIQQAEADRRVRPEALGGGLVDQGQVTLRTATLEFDYGLTDRLALDVSLPYKHNRYEGRTPHDPAVLQDDHGESLIDDGDFHGGWADWGVGLRWLWRTEPFVVTPFVTAHFPATDYPIYSATARGTKQWRLDVGVNAGGRFGGAFRNVTWQAGGAFMFMEKTRIENGPDHRINHSLVSFQLGYAASPQWSYSLAWRYRRAHGALRMPDDFNFPLTDDLWYHHDQLLGLEQAVVEAGVSYQLNDRYAVYASVGRTNHVAFGQEIRKAFGIGISRSF